MRGISEAGSNPKCLVSEGSVVKKKETAGVYYFFPTKLLFTKWKGIATINRLSQGYKRSVQPPPPPPPHRTPLRSYQPMKFNLYKGWLSFTNSMASSPQFNMFIGQFFRLKWIISEWGKLGRFWVWNMFSLQNRNDKQLITCKLPFILISDVQ